MDQNGRRRRKRGGNRLSDIVRRTVTMVVQAEEVVQAGEMLCSAPATLIVRIKSVPLALSS